MSQIVIMKRIDESMSKGSVDCKLISQYMAFTILGITLFGDEFLAWSEANFYEELLMMIPKDSSFWASYRFTPFWKLRFWKCQSSCIKLKFLIQDIVQQCQKNCKLLCRVDENFNDETLKYGTKAACGKPPSYVGMQDKIFSSELDDHLNGREEPCENIMCMMFHGCIATAGLIGSILDRLVTQIWSCRIRQGLVEDVHNVDKMFLLLATVYESALLRPAGPLLQRCSTKTDLRLKNGVTIPAGAVLVVPVHLQLMDDTNWGSDAGKFNPYRFLSEARKVSDSAGNTSFTGDAADPIQDLVILNDPNNNAAFLPFGIRSCVGQKFVIQGVATLFASLLECYEACLLFW